MSEFVSLQVVTLEKPHVTHGTSKWLHPYTHTEHTIIQPTYQGKKCQRIISKNERTDAEQLLTQAKWVG